MLARLIAMGLLYSSGAMANGLAGDTFYSETIKQQICDIAVKKERVHGVRESDCKRANFQFSKDKTTVQIEGVNRPLTTLMRLEFSSNGIDMEAVVTALLETSSDGRIQRVGWSVLRVTPLSYSNEAVIQNTWEEGKNIKEILLSDVPSSTAAKMDLLIKNHLLASLQEAVSASGDGRIDGDLELNALVKLRAIVDSVTKETLAYVISGVAMSESGDIRLQADYKFSLDAKLIDSRTESFGYHE